MPCMNAQHTKHVTYKLAYHFVWCPKYRKKLLVGKLAIFVEQELRRICEAQHMSGPILKESQEEHKERTKYTVILPEEESRVRIAL
jgi:REP element-mobilizing transposase RayT